MTDWQSCSWSLVSVAVIGAFDVIRDAVGGNRCGENLRGHDGQRRRIKLSERELCPALRFSLSARKTGNMQSELTMGRTKPVIRKKKEPI